jgi:hypothetical protein
MDSTLREHRIAWSPRQRWDLALIFDVGRRNDWQPVERRLGIFLSNDTALADLRRRKRPAFISAYAVVLPTL